MRQTLPLWSLELAPANSKTSYSLILASKFSLLFLVLHEPKPPSENSQPAALLNNCCFCFHSLYITSLEVGEMAASLLITISRPFLLLKTASPLRYTLSDDILPPFPIACPHPWSSAETIPSSHCQPSFRLPWHRHPPNTLNSQFLDSLPHFQLSRPHPTSATYSNRHKILPLSYTMKQPQNLNFKNPILWPPATDSQLTSFSMVTPTTPGGPPIQWPLHVLLPSTQEPHALISYIHSIASHPWSEALTTTWATIHAHALLSLLPADSPIKTWDLVSLPIVYLDQSSWPRLDKNNYADRWFFKVMS